MPIASRMGGDHITLNISMRIAGAGGPPKPRPPGKKGAGGKFKKEKKKNVLLVGCMRQCMDDREMIDIGGDTGDYEHDRRTVSRARADRPIMRPACRKKFSKRSAPV